jgi:hypothetical protein
LAAERPVMRLWSVSSLRSMIQDAVQQRYSSVVSGDQPLINIEEMSVRSDDDIRKISQQLNTLC